MAIRVYSYECKVTEGFDHMVEQLFKAHRYRNALCAIERKRREDRTARTRQYSEPLDAVTTAIETLTGQLEEARRDIKNANAQARRRIDTAEARERAADIRQQLSEQRRVQRDIRQQLRDDSTLKGHLKAIDDAAKQAKRDARGLASGAGLYWGTYLCVEAAADAWGRSVTPPRFVSMAPYAPQGKISVQLQKEELGDGVQGLGLRTKTIMACSDNRLRIEITGRNPGKKEGSRRYNHMNVVVWLRAGSTGKRNTEPIWVKAKFVLSRPLPKNGVVKSAYILARRLAGEMVTTVNFVVKDEFIREDAAFEGKVGVDLGWRVTPHGLRIATWHGFDGRTGELLIPLEHGSGNGPSVTAGEHADHIRSVRTRNFDAMRGLLQCWKNGSEIPEAVMASINCFRQAIVGNIASIAASDNRKPYADGLAAIDWLLSHFPSKPLQEDFPGPVTVPGVRTMPEWWLGDHGTENVHLWKSPARLADLVWRWRRDCPEAGKEMLTVLDIWEIQDKHLWQWESNIRRKFTAWRLHTYRDFTAKLRRQYKTVVLEETNWQTFKTIPEPESILDGTPLPVRKCGIIAAPGLLAQTLKNGFPGHVMVAPENTTRECNLCGFINTWDQAAELTHTCMGCGETWDQDENAAYNILKRGLASAPTVVGEYD